MESYPKTVRVDLKWSPATGLIAAESEELPSLLTVGKSLQEIEKCLLPSIEALIQSEFGVKVRAYFDDKRDDEREDIRSLSEPRVIELRPS